MAAEIDKADKNVVFAQKSNRLLVILGLLLVGLAIAGAVYAREEGGETKETKPAASPAANQTVTTTTTTKTAPSDTLLTAVLASGAAIIVAGALYHRITAIKLPGGVEIDLTDQEKEKVTKKVGEELAGKPAERVATATEKALDLLRKEKARMGVLELPETQIIQRVSQVTEAYK